MPLRLGTELLYLSAAFAFAASLRELGLARGAAIAVFAVIAFEPYTFAIFNYVLAETIYGSLVLFSLAALFMLLARLDEPTARRYAVLFGLALCSTWITRKESPLLAGLLCGLFLLIALRAYARGTQRRDTLRDLWLAVGIPTLVIVAGTTILSTVNFARYGIFATNDLATPGYVAANRALLRIDPSRPVRTVAVTADARRLGYEASPAFRELQQYLDTVWATAIHVQTEEATGVKGELGSGWFYWAFRQAAAMRGHHASARTADAYYRRIADEINSAIDEGKIPGRMTVGSFVDPAFSVWLPALPQSIVKVGRLFLHNGAPVRMSDDPVATDIRKKFDDIAGRRWALVERLEKPGPIGRFLDRARWQGQQLAWAAARLLLYLLAPAAALATLVSAFGRQPRALNLDIAAVILTYMFLSRWALFAVLDASAWPGDQPRYMLAVIAFPAIVSILLLANAWPALADMGSRSRATWLLWRRAAQHGAG